jgi:hypothetical protein
MKEITAQIVRIITEQVVAASIELGKGRLKAALGYIAQRTWLG